MDDSGRTEAAPPVVTPDAPARSGAWWYGLAAAALVALAVGGALWRVAPGAAPASPVAESVPLRPAATPAPPLPVPSPRAWADLASAPAVMLPASFTIVMRGDTNTARDAFLTAFGPAIAPYRAGRYAEAATALESLTTRFPDVEEGWFYLGVSRLYADRPAEAVEPLRRARRSEVVADQALWLEAVALERAGRAGEATVALRGVCDVYREAHAEACAAVPASPR